ncbi:type II toxin-antitoxin system Phd/YefM family antitoxin [Geodermatophilus sp. URMC 62]|uniref:type II toxin-antitoxin system Phd/YefM family antitoxin n=1 Tax=Geodermatophilus sp. URMC 62 TaxID=3423414 RepID=UPI00406D39A4
MRIPLGEAAAGLSQLVEMVEQTHETGTLTRHGREAAVLMAKEDLDALHETLLWLSQPASARTSRRPGPRRNGTRRRPVTS